MLVTYIGCVSISVSSHTQPVVIKERAGEKSTSVQQRTPSVFLVGSKRNVAKLANTRTSTTRLRQPDGSFQQLGSTSESFHNTSMHGEYVVLSIQGIPATGCG